MSETDDDPAVDVVRASRDGHEFHEAWAVRTAQELISPKTTLTALTLEGFAKGDRQDLSRETHDIADLVRYRGGMSFDTANRVEMVQFKYSIAHALEPMTAGSMTKTLSKFAKADSDFIKKWGETAVSKATFELVTNRPIHADALEALRGLRSGEVLKGRVRRQAKTLAEATNLSGERLGSFLSRFSLTGSGGSLAQVSHGNLATMSSWSGATDSLTKLRLGNLQTLIREAAGSAGQMDNQLQRVDILGALGIASERELYPVEAVFPAIDGLIQREQMPLIIDAVLAASRPLLIHAPGGYGKTVVMQAIARHFEEQDDAVLLFDGFGAGEWRNPSDGRHLPHKALPYLANLLAAEGLCDVLIPGSLVEDLVQAFRDRLIAAVEARRRFKPATRIVILLDAADHAGMQAKRTNTISFAHLVLETLSISPIEGVIVAASCRSHRRDEARGQARCRELEIPHFSRNEVAELALARTGTVTAAELVVLERHSRGNPRLLDSLLRRGRPYDREAAPADAEQGLAALLSGQIEAATEAAIERGASDDDIRRLIAGLALLPPPVPIDELAAALAIANSEIESFIADLSPLIAITATGLIFRDEPTETLVSEIVDADSLAQDDLVERIERRQSRSVYAARALPIVLIRLNRTAALVDLAFDDQPVQSAISRVASRAIKTARVQAAAVASARASNFDDLARVALEAVRIGSATERSDAFLRDYPDIVGVDGDEEAIRRLRNDRAIWSGRRHAALAVLEAFLGDRRTAHLEAERAISWINRNFRLRRQKDPSAIRDVADALSDALFVDLLDGNGSRIERFLRRQPVLYAYRIASRIVTLVERLSLSADPKIVVPAIEALSTCRTRCVAIYASVLASSFLSKSVRKSVTRRLAKLEPAPFEPPQYWNRDRGFDRAIQSAAARAAVLGLRPEALALLKHATSEDIRSYKFTDPWPLTSDLSDFLQVAAIRRSVRNRPTSLLDLAATDMLDAVSPSSRSRGPAAFAKAIDRVIALSATGPNRDRKANRPSADEARNWRSIIDHRMPFLFQLVDQAAAILAAKDPTSLIVDALDQAKVASNLAEDYPLRGQRQFLASRALDLIRWASLQRDAIGAAAGNAFADFVISLDFKMVSAWTETIKLLAGSPACHAAALRLARSVGPVIAADTDIETQIRAYGAVSIALWPISTDEARAYFKQGLELADNVGSGDHEQVSQLLAFAANYQGPPLSPETTHKLGLLSELNIPDETEGFDWANFASAFARLDGARSLALCARLADRGKADLGMSLPPLLAALVREKRLAPELAAANGFLEPIAERWDWRTPAFARPVMEALAENGRHQFGQELIVELDRSDMLFAGSEKLEGYRALFSDNLPPGALPRERIEAWISLKGELAGSPSDPKARVAPPQLVGATPITQHDLDTAIATELGKYKSQKPTEGWVLSGFVEDLSQPRHRIWLLDAVMDRASISFEEKLKFLDDANQHWAGQSIALDSRLASAVERLALGQLVKIVTPVGNARPIDRAVTVARDTAPNLITSIVKALAAYDFDISSSFWMTSARVAAQAASPPAIALALERHTALATQALPKSFGDGPWGPSFQLTDDESEIAAGLLWARLGSPDARDRWRAAHALRRVVGYGRHDVLSALVARLPSRDAGPFQDRKYPFFHMHAALWLLIAMARVAIDNPDAIAPHRAALKGVATDRAFPHVGMRHFAIMALRATLTCLNKAARAAEEALLDKLNRPSAPPTKATGSRANHYGTRPANMPEPKGLFRFDYDFSKYQFDPLGETFGRPTWEIGDRANGWIRKWDSKITAMWDCPRSTNSSQDRNWSIEAFADSDLYGGYLGRHALHLTAGELVDTQAAVIGRYSDDTDPWLDWLERVGLTRADGLWLADGTDLFPLDGIHPIMVGEASGEAKDAPKHPLDLLPLAAIPDALEIEGWLRVSGAWTSSDDLSVEISSRLVEPAKARISAYALHTAPSGYAFFPSDDDRRIHGASPPCFEPWLTGWPETNTRIDGQDPYGNISAETRRAPADSTATRMGARSNDPFNRTWVSSANIPIFRAEAWGGSRGRGRHQSDRVGRRLEVDTKQLLGLLEKTDRTLVLHVRVRRHLDNKKIGEEAYRQQVLTSIIRADGRVEAIWKVPPKVAEAVASLDAYDRTEFEARLKAIGASGPIRASHWPKDRVRGEAVSPHK